MSGGLSGKLKALDIPLPSRSRTKKTPHKPVCRPIISQSLQGKKKSIGVSELHKIRQSTFFEMLKLGNVPSERGTEGTEIFQIAISIAVLPTKVYLSLFSTMCDSYISSRSLFFNFLYFFYRAKTDYRPLSD